MSKTPRTDTAWDKHATDDKTGFNIALDMRREMLQLETELADMRKQFSEYVKAEDAWRDEMNKMKWDDLRIEAAKLRKQRRC